jgi:ABC-type multidrug transport system fused ATPase/permease subunit
LASEKMSNREVKIKIGPNETMRFPAICVHCAHPAQESMALKKKDGRIIRQVDVPLCDKCVSQLRRRSAGEERLQKLSRLFSVVAGLVTVVGAFMVMSGFVFWLRLPLALLLGVAAAALVTSLFRPAINRAALPQKQAVQNSAQLEAFSWRTATFLFSNEDFVERFEALNESLLVET